MTYFNKPTFSYKAIVKSRDEEFCCPGSVLAAQSSLFHEILSNGSSEILVDNAKLQRNFSTVKDACHFIAGGNLDITLQNVELLMIFSSIYAIPKLQEACNAWLVNNLSYRTVFRLFDMTENLDEVSREKYKDTIYNFVSEYDNEVCGEVIDRITLSEPVPFAFVDMMIELAPPLTRDLLRVIAAKSDSTSAPLLIDELIAKLDSINFSNIFQDEETFMEFISSIQQSISKMKNMEVIINVQQQFYSNLRECTDDISIENSESSTEEEESESESESELEYNLESKTDNATKHQSSFNKPFSKCGNNRNRDKRRQHNRNQKQEFWAFKVAGNYDNKHSTSEINQTYPRSGKKLNNSQGSHRGGSGGNTQNFQSDRRHGNAQSSQRGGNAQSSQRGGNTQSLQRGGIGGNTHSSQSGGRGGNTHSSQSGSRGGNAQSVQRGGNTQNSRSDDRGGNTHSSQSGGRGGNAQGSQRGGRGGNTRSSQSGGRGGNTQSVQRGGNTHSSQSGSRGGNAQSSQRGGNTHSSQSGNKGRNAQSSQRGGNTHSSQSGGRGGNTHSSQSSGRGVIPTVLKAAVEVGILSNLKLALEVGIPTVLNAAVEMPQNSHKGCKDRKTGNAQRSSKK